MNYLNALDISGHTAIFLKYNTDIIKKNKKITEISMVKTNYNVSCIFNTIPQFILYQCSAQIPRVLFTLLYKYPSIVEDIFQKRFPDGNKSW